MNNPHQPVRCHKCKEIMQEEEGYWVALRHWHSTINNLPVVGHLYCGRCIEKVYEIAFRKGLKNILRRLFLGPGVLGIARQVREQIIQNGWTKKQWKERCREEVSWWWECHRLVSQGRVPPWEHTISDVDGVIGRYRRQSEAWNICGQICDSVDAMSMNETIGMYDNFIANFPDFAPYAYYCRGVWLDRIGNAEFAISDFSRALELDPQLHWGYYYRAVCYHKTGNLEEATRDKDLALELIRNLRRSFTGNW